MHKGERLPLARDSEPMSAALVTMTQKSFGCLGIVDAKGKLIGIVTDGDLRRHMGADLVRARTADIMTRRPKTATPKMLASAALELINASRITALFVVEKGRPVGIVHIHDLLARRHRLNRLDHQHCARNAGDADAGAFSGSTSFGRPHRIGRAARTLRPPGSIASTTVTTWPTSSAPRRFKSGSSLREMLRAGP